MKAKNEPAKLSATQESSSNDSSPVVCDEILQFCALSRGVPALEILKQQVRLISCFSSIEPSGKNKKPQVASPEVILSCFNELLPVAETISALAGEEYERNRSYLVGAIVVFVRLLKCQLDSFQERKTSELRDETVDAFKSCIVSVQNLVDLIPDDNLTSLENLSNAIQADALVQKRLLKESLGALHDIIPSACNIVLATFQKTKVTNDFYRTVDSVIDKLGRYSNVIGPEPRIGELVRDYSRWMDGIERKRRLTITGIAWMTGIKFDFSPTPANDKQGRAEIARKFDRKVEMCNPLLPPKSNALCDELLSIARAHDDNAVLSGIGIGIKLAKSGIPTQDEIFESILTLLSSFGDIGKLPQNVKGECRNLHAKTIGNLSKILVDMLKENASSGVLRNLLESGLKIAGNYQVLLKSSGMPLDSCERIETLIDSIVYYNGEDGNRFIRQSGIPDLFGPSSFSSDLFLKFVSLCERCQSELGPSRRVAEMIHEYAARLYKLKTEENNRQLEENVKIIYDTFSSGKGRKNGTLPRRKKIFAGLRESCEKSVLFARRLFLALSLLAYGSVWWLVWHFRDIRSMRIAGCLFFALTLYPAISSIRHGIFFVKMALCRRNALKLENMDFARRLQENERYLQKMNELATKIGEINLEDGVCQDPNDINGREVK